MEIPDIKEIDIIPLLGDAKGKVTAVDALVVLGKTTDKKIFTLPVDPKNIGKLFYPKSIAFVGASAKIGKWGNCSLMLLRGNIRGKFIW